MEPPTDLEILKKVDLLSAAIKGEPVSINLFLESIEPEYHRHTVSRLYEFVKLGILEAGKDRYKITGKHEGVSIEVKKFIINRFH